MGIRRNAGTWTEHTDRNATVDKAVPAHGAALAELAKRPVLNPSAHELPPLSNAPKGTLPPSLKKQG